MSVHAPLGLVVAVANDGIIGQTGGHLGLPWHIPEDLKHFKRVTLHHPIIMGRTTHEAIAKALPKRLNIVLSTDASRRFDGCELAISLMGAIRLARRRSPDRMPMIIGGESVYRAALPQVTHIHLTRVAREVQGDAHFPEFDERDFELVEERPAETPDVTFMRWVRRTWLAGS